MKISREAVNSTSYRLVPILLFLILALFLAASGCYKEKQAKLTVVTTTTMIKTIVQSIGGERVAVTAVVPGGMCPGHFDIKPKQVETISRADLFLYHGWEKWVKDLTRIEPDKHTLIAVNVEGNWLVPDVHLEAIDVVTGILSEFDPEGAQKYRDNATAYGDRVAAEAQSLCERFSRYRGTTIICSELQAEFLSWLGFDIVGTYGRQEELTPKAIANLIDRGKKSGVTLVIDNLQSGGEIGKGIAEEIGAGHVTLSNFPVDGTYLDTLRKNAHKLENALRR